MLFVWIRVTRMNTGNKLPENRVTADQRESKYELFARFRVDLSFRLLCSFSAIEKGFLKLRLNAEALENEPECERDELRLAEPDLPLLVGRRPDPRLDESAHAA